MNPEELAKQYTSAHTLLNEPIQQLYTEANVLLKQGSCREDALKDMQAKSIAANKRGGGRKKQKREQK